MQDFLNWRWWLNTRPGALGPISEKVMAGFLVLMIVIALLLAILKKNYKRSSCRKTYGKISSFAWTNFIIGAFLAFFIYEIVPYLSMRLLILFWIVGMIVWAFFIIKTLSIIPKIKQEREKEKEFKKYIP